MVETPQEATAFFFVPVAAAYVAPCAVWLALCSRQPRLWVAPQQLETQRPWLDLGLALAAAVGILLLGAAYRGGYLVPRAIGPPALVWLINSLIIYSPLALVLLVRHQPAVTAFVSPARLPKKLAWGIGGGALSLVIYLALRGELDSLGGILSKSIKPQQLVHFVPVFLEGVAVAFVFVRLRWALGLWSALAVPALLFAVAHIPGQLAEQRGFGEIAAFFALNSVLPAAVLYVAQRGQDVIWLGVIHYFVDVAIQAV